MQTAATLISFGLLKDEGTGDKRKLQLTLEAALRILLDRVPTAERAELIKQVALLPKIHKQLWDRWGQSRPSNVEVRHRVDRGVGAPFNDKSVDGFIKEYSETIRFAKLDQSDETVAEPVEAEPGASPKFFVPKIGDYVQWEINDVLQLPEANAGPSYHAGWKVRDARRQQHRSAR